MQVTKAYVRDMITRVSPGALLQSKRQTYLDYHRDIGTSVEEANRLLAEMVKQPAYKEAIKAFLEKRTPVWPAPE
jgi:enoyl-CoA hydratase/carnithine racemase